MSVDTCKACDAYIDTDHEPDCYVETKYGDICLCERCRERREQEIEAREDAAANAACNHAETTMREGEG